jgi:hypothetical protein
MWMQQHLLSHQSATLSVATIEGGPGAGMMTLLGLPPELRLQIFDHLSTAVVDSSAITNTTDGTSLAGRSAIQPFSDALKTLLSLSQTNSAIRCEALPVLFRNLHVLMTQINDASETTIETLKELYEASDDLMRDTSPLNEAWRTEMDHNYDDRMHWRGRQLRLREESRMVERLLQKLEM